MNVIACNRVKDSPFPAVLGTRVVRCATCNAELWASPSSVKALQDRDYQPYCLIPCAPRKISELKAASGEEVEFDGAPGWQEEMRAAGAGDGVTLVEDMLKRLNRSADSP